MGTIKFQGRQDQLSFHLNLPEAHPTIPRKNNNREETSVYQKPKTQLLKIVVYSTESTHDKISSHSYLAEGRRLIPFPKLQIMQNMSIHKNKKEKL